jgi:hypothetical protein
LEGVIEGGANILEGSARRRLKIFIIEGSRVRQGVVLISRVSLREVEIFSRVPLAAGGKFVSSRVPGSARGAF